MSNVRDNSCGGEQTRYDADFDQYAEQYDSLMEKSLQGVCSQDSAFFRELKMQYLTALYESMSPPSRILDFGCGGYGLVIDLDQAFPSSTVVGYDVSSKQIEIAQKRFADHPSVSFTSQLPTNQFDLIIVANVLHHVPFQDRNTVFNQLCSLLGDSGKLVIIEHNPVNPITRYLVKHCKFDEDAELVRLSGLYDLIREHGLVGCGAHYISLFPWRGKLFRSVERLLRRIPLGAQYMVEIGKPVRRDVS